MRAAKAGTPLAVTRSVPPQRTEPPGSERQWWRRLGSIGDSRTGAPPARSALGLRFALALFGLVFCGAFTAVALDRQQPAAAVVLAILAAVALVDLFVIVRRMRQRDR